MGKLTAVTEPAITQVFEVPAQNSFVAGVELLGHTGGRTVRLAHHLHLRCPRLYWRVEAVSNIVLLRLLVNYGHTIGLLPRLIKAYVIVLLRGLLILIAAQLFLYILLLIE